MQEFDNIDSFDIDDFRHPLEEEESADEAEIRELRGVSTNSNGSLKVDDNKLVKYYLKVFYVVLISGTLAFYNRTLHIYEFLDSHVYLSFFKIILDEINPYLWTPKLESKVKLRFVREIPIILKEFHIPKDYVIFNNGAFRISNGTFLEGDHPKKIINNCCTGYDFDADADCPKFKEFLNDVFNGDTALIKVVQETMGYTLLYGENPLQIIVLLIGEGRNGKGILTSVCQMVHGEKNCSGTSISQLNSPFGLSQLYDKVINISNENDENVITDTSILKTISGNDTVMVERKYHDAFPAKIDCKIWIATNDIMFRDSSRGFEERLVPIPFENTYVSNPIPGTNQKKRDNMLLKRLEQEKSGIFNWMYEGLVRLRKNKWKLTHSDAVFEQRKQIVEESNPVQLFVNQLLVQVSSARTKKPETYKQFQAWAKINNISAGDNLSAQRFHKKFASILESKGINAETVRIKGADYYKGICLKEIDSI